MSEKAPGSGNPEQYVPNLMDWKSLVVLAPYGQDDDNGAALQRALADYAVDLHGPTVETDPLTGNVLVHFYIADPEPESAMNSGIAGVCHGIGAAQIGEVEFVVMHMARELDLQVFGQGLLGDASNEVGQPAYDAYRQHTEAQEQAYPE